MLSLVSVLVLCTGVASVRNSTVFIEQPNAGHILAPATSQVQLNCSVSEYYGVDWSVTLPGKNTVYTDQRDVVSTLRQHGIQVVGLTSPSSMLKIRLDRTNNGTVVACVAIKDVLQERSFGEHVQVIFYGPPPPPSALTATGKDLNSVNISWSLNFFESVPVYFTLTATNLNDSHSEPIIISNIKSQHYIFIKERTFCDVYSYQVTAMADSGSSDPSKVITKAIPALPDIEAILDSVNHSLQVRNAFEDVSLNVTFNAVLLCPDYPINNYTLFLENFEETRITDSVPATSSFVSFSIDGLAANSRYTYCITGSNQFGTSNKSSPVEISTTDVQNVSICQVEDSTTYSIHCGFLEGTVARGCVYFLSSSAGQNWTGNIEKTSSSVHIDLSNLLGDLSESSLLAFDWEVDNSSGIVPVEGSTVEIRKCSTGDTDDAFIFIIILATLLGLMLLVIIIIGSGFTVGRKRKYFKEVLNQPFLARQLSSASYRVNDGMQNDAPTLPDHNGHYEKLTRPRPPLSHNRSTNYSFLQRESPSVSRDAPNELDTLGFHHSSAIFFQVNPHADVSTPEADYTDIIIPGWNSRGQVTSLV